MKKILAIILIIIACISVFFIVYQIKDMQWQNEQLVEISNDFLEAVVALDVEKIDSYCIDSTRINGAENYFYFKKDILSEWEKSQVEVIRYDITGESANVTGWFFFEIEYYDSDGELKVQNGHFQVSRDGKKFWISWLSF